MTKANPRGLRQFRHRASTKDLSAVLRFLEMFPRSHKSDIAIGGKVSWAKIDDALSWLVNKKIIIKFQDPNAVWRYCLSGRLV